MVNIMHTILLWEYLHYYEWNVMEYHLMEYDWEYNYGGHQSILHCYMTICE